MADHEQGSASQGSHHSGERFSGVEDQAENMSECPECKRRGYHLKWCRHWQPKAVSLAQMPYDELMDLYEAVINECIKRWTEEQRKGEDNERTDQTADRD